MASPTVSSSNQIEEWAWQMESLRPAIDEQVAGLSVAVVSGSGATEATRSATRPVPSDGPAVEARPRVDPGER